MNEKVNPTVRSLLINLINEIMQRPLSNIFFNDGKKEPFESIKSKLESNDPMTLEQFSQPIQSFFSDMKASESKYISGSALVLEKFFNKKMAFISSLHNYCLKDVLVASAKKAFPNIDENLQNSENNPSNDINNQKEMKTEKPPNEDEK